MFYCINLTWKNIPLKYYMLYSILSLIDNNITIALTINMH